MFQAGKCKLAVRNTDYGIDEIYKYSGILCFRHSFILAVPKEYQ